MKKDRIEVAQCINGEYVFESDKQATQKAVGVSTMVTAATYPTMALASTQNTFSKIYDAAVSAVDAGVVFVFMFGAVAWILGNRGKAMEILLCASSGYIIYLNAANIRDFLRSLVPDTGGI